MARAFLVGFLVCAAFVRIAPADPSVAFLLGGAAVGLASATAVEALVLAVAAQLVTFFVLLIPVAGQTPQLPPTLFGLGLIAAAVGAATGWFAAQKLDRKHLAWGLAALLVLVFVVQGLTVAKPIAEQIAVEPPNEQFSFDPVFFVKVFYLQENGRSFYPAYGEAFAADKRFDAATPDLAGWRSPTTSTLWSLVFGNGGQIVYAFVLLAALAMAGVYFLSSGVSDEVSALGAMAVLAPYYLFAVQRFWFTEYEFWAAFVVIASAVLYRLKRYWPSVGLALLGGSMREWLLSGSMAGAIDLLSRKKWKQAIPWIAAVVLIAAVYVVNMVFVRRYLESVGIAPNLGAAGRVGGGGPGFILYTVKFCGDLLAHPLVVPYLVFALGLVGAARSILRREFYLPALLILPLLAFMIFGSGKGPSAETGWNDYYNAAYWPFAALLAPAALGFLERRKEAGK